MALGTSIKVGRRASRRGQNQEGSLDLGWERKPGKGEGADCNLRERTERG